MFFPHPKPPPNVPNSKEALPTSNLVIFAHVYMIPPYQNYLLHSLPSLPASRIPYPAPINIYYIPPVPLAAIQACD